MKFDILTLFPEAFDSFLSTSIIGKAIEKKKISAEIFDIREFSDNKHRKVDDVPYGGGAGMVMMCQPLFAAIDHIRGLSDDGAPVIFFSPHGEVLSQSLCQSYADEISAEKLSRVILLCGHYEGIDQRVIDQCVDRQISLGNFVLTGGELPAQVFIDSVARLLPGVLGKPESHEEESFSPSFDGKLEHPHYTRPENFRGFSVPPVLLSGHHAEIEKWRKEHLQ